MSRVDKLLQGSIDMHVHAGPDAFIERRMDALEVAMLAREYGMRGIVFKSHSYLTAPMSHIVNQAVTGISTYGSLCLEYETGGISIPVVEAAGELGARVIWMPTFSAKNARLALTRLLGVNFREEGFNILEEENIETLRQIFPIMKKHNVVLATGHLSPQEIFSLVKEAKQAGLTKIVITHAMCSQGLDKSLTVEDQVKLVEEGAVIEHCFLEIVSSGGRRDAAQMVQAMKLIGAEHCIMSTDFGQNDNPPPPEGMRMFIATMLKYGMKEAEVELMVKVNPARLLDLS